MKKEERHVDYTRFHSFMHSHVIKLCIQKLFQLINLFIVNNFNI